MGIQAGPGSKRAWRKRQAVPRICRNTLAAAVTLRLLVRLPRPTPGGRRSPQRCPGSRLTAMGAHARARAWRRLALARSGRPAARRLLPRGGVAMVRTGRPPTGDRSIAEKKECAHDERFPRLAAENLRRIRC